MKIILAAGGSGGHIFPSVAVAEEIRKKGPHKVYFVSSKRRLDRNILEKYRPESFFLSINPMPLRPDPVKMIVFVCKFIADAVKSVFIVLKTRPDVIVGFGGYSSGAIVLAGKAMGVPIVIHEQNILPGRANKVLAKIADRIAVSFEESKGHFNAPSRALSYTGNPLRFDILSFERPGAYNALGLDPSRFTILIMGGSQGSSFLNKTVSRAAVGVTEELKNEVQFIHITGKKDEQEIKEFYRERGVKAAVFSFMERIDAAYSISDLVISRAGAAALFELAYYAKPMILIPYPNPKNNQRFNALFFSEKGAALYREEKDLEPDILRAEILDIIQDKERLREMSFAAGKLAVPAAGKTIADIVLETGQMKRVLR